jgi:hypothetical protein
MRKKAIILTLIILPALLVFIYILRPPGDIYFTLPFDNSVFPPEFPSPNFEWGSKNAYNGPWDVTIVVPVANFKYKITTEKTNWIPDKQLWDSIKKVSDHKIINVALNESGKNFRKIRLKFTISTDSVAAPILYRQMPIPFVLAEKNLDSMNYRLIDIGSYNTPHIAMKEFPVCGNCHSITQKGGFIGLDLDAGRRDKGGYFVASIKDSMLFSEKNYMSWTKIENRRTFGLFSKISPDGRYIVTTVKDRVVGRNYPYGPDHIAFSQLFFPVNGHLAVYDRKEHILKELPGANSDEYVQSNATWTPDSKNIVFCRAKALPMKEDLGDINILNEALIDDFEKGKRSFKYEICIIPFNEGSGGKAIPLKGASDNGLSNYFPAVSPDGKWIIFCKAKNFMLLQPDSRLFIIPVKGGKSRLLECNLSSMNSWHAWSPNSKWIVFVSKGLSIYTDMFLSHIDNKGNASAPVLLSRARQFRKVTNYPEFVNINPQRTLNMKYDFVELIHIQKALDAGNKPLAIALFKKLIKQDHLMLAEDYYLLSNYLYKMDLPEEAAKYKKIADQK